MYAKVGNRPDAEDLTAEVFRATLRPLRLGGSRPEVRGYLAAAAAQWTLAAYWRRRIGAEATRIELGAALRFLDDPQTAPTPVPGPSGCSSVCLSGTGKSSSRASSIRSASKKRRRPWGFSVSSAKVLQYRALRMAARTNGSPQLVSTD